MEEVRYINITSATRARRAPSTYARSSGGPARPTRRDLKPPQQRRRPPQALGPYIRHGEGSGVTADTLATNERVKVQQLPSRNYGHTA
jgi:hypothetical protein